MLPLLALSLTPKQTLVANLERNSSMVLTISLACCHVASKVMRTRLEEGPREEMWRAEAEVDEEKRKKAYRKQLRRGDRPLRRWLAVREEVQRRDL